MLKNFTVPIATSLFNPLVLLSIALWVGAVTAIGRGRRDTALVLSIGWFFITLSPVSNVAFPIGVAKAERLLYLPSVGLCLLAGWAYRRVEEMGRAEPVPRIALAGILALFMVRTVVRNRDWKDNLTLATWTRPATNKLLFEGGVNYLNHHGGVFPDACNISPDRVLIRDSTLGFTYNGVGVIASQDDQTSTNQRFSVSYVTGSHNLKVGMLANRDRPQAALEQVFTYFPMLKTMLHRKGGVLSCTDWPSCTPGLAG